MGRAARLNPCSYAGGKKLPEVVTARTKRQLRRDSSAAAIGLWLQHARFTDKEKAFVRSRGEGR